MEDVFYLWIDVFRIPGPPFRPGADETEYWLVMEENLVLGEHCFHLIPRPACEARGGGRLIKSVKCINIIFSEMALIL